MALLIFQLDPISTGTLSQDRQEFAETGPVAVKSSFGWLLFRLTTSTANNMGSLLNLIISRPAEVYSVSINDTNLVKTIEKFWKIQSLGNKEQALQEWENSLNTNVSYKND